MKRGGFLRFTVSVWGWVRGSAESEGVIPKTALSSPLSVCAYAMTKACLRHESLGCWAGIPSLARGTR